MEKTLFDACEKAGVYGLIIPDLPHELVQQLKIDILTVKLILFH